MKPDHIYRKLKRLYLFILCIMMAFFSTVLSAQPDNWNIRFYTAEDGLSSNRINCIIKDPGEDE